MEMPNELTMLYLNHICRSASTSLESGEELPQVLGISTVPWRHKRSDKDLASVFESYLKELNSPFHKATNMAGWFFTKSQEAKSWLQSRGSTETVASLNNTVLDVPAEALPMCLVVSIHFS